VNVRLSSPDKVLWPDVGLTKADLWAYYTAIAPRLLPQIVHRPLTLKRYPDGIDGDQSFFQKALPKHAPPELDRWCQWSDSSNREVCYLLARRVEDLHWCAQFAALELHPWLARVDEARLADRPDTLLLDLDPGEDSVPVTTAACWVREVLDALDLASLVKTSGKRGLHVLVPIERRYSTEEVRGFGLALARAVASRHPDALTVEMRKERRRGRLLLDWSRAGAAQTIVAAWSPRATRQATVAMPLHWDEVDASLDPTRFTLATAPDEEDRWAAGTPAPQRIETARDALAGAGFPAEDRSPRSSRPIG
jgi:bifunctional non-homologous end joining protein LigD